MDAETESTGTSIEETTENLCDNPTRDTLAEGLMGLLKPTIDRLDERVKATRISQLELKQELEGVLDELKKISDSQKSLPNLDEYVKLLTVSKQKITIISALLQSSQEKLNKIHETVAKETARKKLLLQNEEVPSGSGIPSTSTAGETSSENIS